MPKPLNEMQLPELLEILTPAQKNSLLAYARQLARNTLSPNATWFVDGRVNRMGKAVRRSASNRTAEPGRLVKCSECGLRVDEREIKNHWDSTHLAKKQKRPSGGKGTKVSNEVGLKKPRLVQGGLCNPR